MYPKNDPEKHTFRPVTALFSLKTLIGCSILFSSCRDHEMAAATGGALRKDGGESCNQNQTNV